MFSSDVFHVIAVVTAKTPPYTFCWSSSWSTTELSRKMVLDQYVQTGLYANCFSYDFALLNINAHLQVVSSCWFATTWLRSAIARPLKKFICNRVKCCQAPYIASFTVWHEKLQSILLFSGVSCSITCRQCVVEEWFVLKEIKLWNDKTFDN